MDLSCRVIPDNDDPRLWQWWATAMPKWERLFGCLGEPRMPKMWFGLYSERELITAYGCDILKDGTCFIQAALCEPSKRGLAGLTTLAIMMRAMATQRKMRFFVASHNRRMLRITKALGAHTVAELQEV